MKFYFLTLLVIPTLSLSACSSVRDQMGLTRTGPDEFKVVKNAPLEIPPSLNQLPTPQPGAPRPQERAVTERAMAALLGNDKAIASRPSSGEAALLQQAGAIETTPDIRKLIDSENVKDPSKEPIGTRLLGIGGDRENETLDPKAEAERLKKANQ